MSSFSCHSTIAPSNKRLRLPLLYQLQEPRYHLQSPMLFRETRRRSRNSQTSDRKNRRKEMCSEWLALQMEDNGEQDDLRCCVSSSSFFFSLPFLHPKSRG